MTLKPLPALIISIIPLEWNGRIISTLRSPRAILGSLVVLDLTRLFNLLASVPEWLVPAISVGVGLLASDFVGIALTWGIVTVAFYVFVPQMYPAETGVPRDAPGFRVLVTLGSFGVFFFFYRETVIRLSDTLAWQIPTSVFSASEGATIEWLVLITGSIVGLTGTALTLYLVNRHDWQLFDPEGQTINLVNKFHVFTDIREKAAEDLSREGLHGKLERGSWVVMVAVVAGFPCFVAGVIASILYLADPLPDLLVLGWVAAGVVTPAVPSLRQPIDADIESRLYDVVKYATRSRKGMIVTVLSAVGLIFAVLLTILPGIGTVPIVATEIINSLDAAGDMSVLTTLRLSAATGVVLSLLAAGVYSIWFWLREFRRLPAFLASWEGVDDQNDIPTRPLGLILPPMVVLVVIFRYAFFMVETIGDGIGQEQFMLVILPLAVGWPLLLGVLAIPVWLTRQRSPQDIIYEDHVVTVSLAIQVVAAWLMFPPNFRPEFIRGPAVFILIGIYTAVALFPNVARYGERDVFGLGNYVVSIYLAILAVGCGSLTLIPGTPFPTLWGPSGVFFGLLAIASAGVTFYDL